MKNYNDILARYTRMRAAGIEMNNAMMDLANTVVQQAAKDLGLFHKGSLTIDESEVPVLLDHAIHHRFDGVRNVAERYAASRPAEALTDAAAVQAAWERVFFSIFRIDKKVPGVGAHVTDVLRDQKYFLADNHLGTTAVQHVVLAARLLPFAGFHMTTGAPQVVGAATLERVGDKLHQEDLSHEDIREMPPVWWAQFETLTIRSCLHDGQAMNTQLRYGDVQARKRPAGDGPDDDRTTPPGNPAYVGRNKPCPCGSGKKHRKCCGR